MQEREQKCDAHHEDKKLWGAVITNMITKVMKGVAPGQGVREKEREKAARMEGGGLEASQQADMTQEEGPEARQWPQQQPKPKLQLKLQPRLEPVPKAQPLPTPARGWETVPPRTQSQEAPASPAHATTTGSSIAERRLILRRDHSVPLPNKMDLEIASAIDRALIQQKAPANVRIMNAKRNAKCTITAITHQNSAAAMALAYRDVIITADRAVEKGVIDVEVGETWERLKIHAVPLVRCMGQGTEVLQKMRDTIHGEIEGVMIPVQVRWLAHPHTIREMRQRG